MGETNFPEGAIVNISFLKNGEPATGLGRHQLLSLIEAAKAELLVVYENLTATQKRCTALLDETRAQRRRLAGVEYARDMMTDTLGALAEAIKLDEGREIVEACEALAKSEAEKYRFLEERLARWREKYPRGATLVALVDELGEFVHARNKGEGVERERDELLDVAAVAVRLYLGEEDGPLLPGFTCAKCGAFTGTAKENHQACRCCYEARPRGPGELPRPRRDLPARLLPLRRRGRDRRRERVRLGAAMSFIETVAALYVEKNGPYWGLEGVDSWDVTRDAKLYDGPHPVVAHPPCSRWCRLAGLVEARWGHKRGEDGGCFASALASVRKWGGVLEHPAYSDAWSAYGLLAPPRGGGWVNADDRGGWTCCVEQGRYGHPAKKSTWLYAVGVVLPSLRWGNPSDGKSGALVSWCGNHVSSGERRPRLGKSAAARTPPEFRDVLLDLARSVRAKGKGAV